MTKKGNVMVVEDEPNVARLVKAYLEKENYNVYVASNGEEAITLFKDNPIDIICLDIMMPKLNGWVVAKTIREISCDVFIIMVSALDSEEDILKGYKLKIDDYITKPFSPKVLVAKINSLMEKHAKTIPSSKMIAGDVEIDTEAYKVYYQKKEINLSKTEYELLLYFVKNSGKICSREQLLDEVWGYDVYVEDRIVDTYVKNLRKHFVDCKYIKTVFGVGYRFEVDVND